MAVLSPSKSIAATRFMGKHRIGRAGLSFSLSLFFFFLPLLLFFTRVPFPSHGVNTGGMNHL